MADDHPELPPLSSGFPSYRTPAADVSGYSEAELTAALAHWRDTRFAFLVTVVLSLAAETHPEELRAALGKVFDLTYWEEAAAHAHAKAGEMMAACEKAQAALDGLRDRYRELAKAIRQAEAKLDSITSPAQEYPRAHRPER